jgi:nicotinate-nucleotide adenylyltransferase
VTRLGILGGTFDAVHHGHLDAADAARHACSLDRVLFVPAHDPPHKPVDPRASGYHRFAMLALALDGRAGEQVSDLELRRTGPSYTVTTLRELHGQGWRPEQLYFVIGTDAFAEIATWYEYPAVLACANFVVITRPGAETAGLLPESRPTEAGRDSRSSPGPSTGIYHVEARTRDVSSTTIRTRLSERGTIDDLVPAAVARYITAHHLYGATDHRHG